MLNPSGNKYDNHHIMQGLMNIKKSQMQLLKELRNQHQILQKYEIQVPEQKQIHIADNSLSSLKNSSQENMEEAQYEQQNNQFSNRVDFSKNIKNQEQSNKIKNELNILKLQNTLVNEDYLKLKHKYLIEQQKSVQIQHHLNFMINLFNMILKKSLSGSNYTIIRKIIIDQLQIYQLKYPSFKSSSIKETYTLLNQQSKINFKQQNNRIGELQKEIERLKKEKEEYNNKNQKDGQIIKKFTNQLNLNCNNLQSKQNQIQNLTNKILKFTQKNIKLKEQNNTLKDKYNKIKEQNKKLKENIEVLSKEIIQNMNNSNKNNLKDNNKLKNENISQSIKLKKQIQRSNSIDNSYKQKFRIVSQDNIRLQERLRQKNNSQKIVQKNMDKLNEINAYLVKQNEQYKKNIGNMDSKMGEMNKLKQQLELEQKIMHQRSMEQKNNMIKIHLLERQSLEKYIRQLTINEQRMSAQFIKVKNSECALKEIQMKQNHSLKLNSIINHLWIIKQTQYQNIHQLLSQMHKTK